PAKKCPAVMFPAAVRCATSSCTFHLSHHVGAAHCSGVSVSRNSPSDARSAWTIGMRSAMESLLVSSVAKLDDERNMGKSTGAKPLPADRDMQKVLAALGSPIRREILALIWDRDLPAGDIAAAFQVSAPTISQHLNVLREAGLVNRVSEGTFRRYRARRDVLRGLHAALFGDSARWTPADDLPERARAEAHIERVVVAHVDVDVDQRTAFAAFTDPVI